MFGSQKPKADHARLCYNTSPMQRLIFEARRDRMQVLSDSVSTVAHSTTDKTPDRVMRDTADALSGEVFARLYADPAELDDKSCPRWVPPAHSVLDEMPEWESLRASTRRDADLAALAASRILRDLAPHIDALTQEAEQQQDQQDQQDQQGDGSPEQQQGGPGQNDGSGAGQGDGVPTASEIAAAMIAAACEEAKKEVTDVRSGLGGLMPGMEVASASNDENSEVRSKLVEMLASDPNIRKVLREAGRLRRIACKKRVPSEGRSTIVSIEQGGDVSRVLPAQFAFMRDERTRTMFLMDLMERRLQQYQMQGDAPEGRGPMCLLIDRSASMRNWSAEHHREGISPNNLASAVCLAGIAAARKERRDITIIEYNRAVIAAHTITASGEAIALDVNAYTGQLDDRKRVEGGPQKVAMDILTRSATGGTKMDVALKTALGGVVSDRADIVLITDGQSESADEHILNTIEQRRKADGLRVYGMTLNGGHLTDAMTSICDQVTNLDRTGDAGKAAAAGLP